MYILKSMSIILSRKILQLDLRMRFLQRSVIFSALVFVDQLTRGHPTDSIQDSGKFYPIEKLARNSLMKKKNYIVLYSR